jgi:hypothetical protein
MKRKFLDLNLVRKFEDETSTIIYSGDVYRTDFIQSVFFL